MTLNMGPQHPSTHGVFRMVLTVDGERIVAVEPYIGYLHRGIEKLSETLNYRQVITLMDRADYLANFNNELTYVMAVEKLMRIEVPERAEYIRVILCELNRIASHLMFYGAMGSDAGVFGTAFMYAFQAREKIVAAFESVSGARMMHNFFRVGGVRDDLPRDFGPIMARLIPQLRQSIEDCHNLLGHNEVFIARSKGIGTIGPQEAIDYGLSGPALRACGVAEDLRRSDPYSIYPKLDFRIPVGKDGDCYDRYLLRVEEMRQSLYMVEQALEIIPPGPVMAQVPKVLKPPPGEVYVRTENPRGDLGIYLVSQGGDKPYRVKVRAPSFCNLMALEHLLRDCYIADCVMVLGSLDIVLGEVDR